MPQDHQTLTRRERQIMDVLYQRRRASAAQVREHLPDAPGYSAVRALLRILEDKGHIRHDNDGPRYVFFPKVPRSRAKQSAVKHLLQTFFDGSAEQAVAAILDLPSSQLSKDELNRLARLIKSARKESKLQVRGGKR